MAAPWPRWDTTTRARKTRSSRWTSPRPGCGWTAVPCRRTRCARCSGRRAYSSAKRARRRRRRRRHAVTEAAPAWLVVARFDKPHGLKGEALLFALTDDPDDVFKEGRSLMPLGADGQPAGPPVKIVRAKKYHRQWLFRFAGVADRTTLDQWPRAQTFGVPSGELKPPRNDQLYRHEIAGVAVVVNGEVVGVVKELARAPGCDLLVVDVAGRELLVPFRKPIVKQVDRAVRRIELDPPPGLM